ncbi:MAG: hypothetical protein QOH23_1029 [Gaiellaceae bacterium]|jgi:hypothetical protein|nr:hypothetical protein [Gaiellaceae bacterium]
MRTAAAATALVGAAGLLAGPVLADVVPVPPVTVPTVTVPALPPPPTLPVTTTTPPAPISTATAPTTSLPATPAPTTATTRTATTVASPSVSGSAGSPLNLASPSGSNGSSSSGSAGSSSDGDPDRSGLQAAQSSRTWIATSGPKRRRHTTLTFTLSRAETVVFTVRQVSPVCRIAKRFTVKGHAGRNRVRVPAGANPGQLGPGTYSISARTRTGELIRRVTIVVVDGARAPSRDELAAARTSNVCAATTSFAAADVSTGASNQPVQRALSPGTTRSASGPDSGTSSSSGAVLGSTVEQAARTIRPLLVALLALAILLLGVASLPRMAVPEARTSDLLARHRMEIAGLGAAAFVAVLITFLLG